MRFVLDTDVVLAGLRSPAGASAALLGAAEVGAVVLLVSAPAVIEYEAVLKRPANLRAVRLDAAGVDAVLDDLVARAEHVDPWIGPGPVRDPGDDLFARLAFAGRADALVTFNLRDYRPADDRGGPFGFVARRPGGVLRGFAWRP